jgi:hypothetical protein
LEDFIYIDEEKHTTEQARYMKGHFYLRKWQRHTNEIFCKLDSPRQALHTKREIPYFTEDNFIYVNTAAVAPYSIPPPALISFSLKVGFGPSALLQFDMNEHWLVCM